MLNDIQQEVSVWSHKNFGVQPSYRSLLGVAEEVGELCHAHLKGEQDIRHTPDKIFDLKRDAVGDIVIFLLDYCGREHINLSDCVEEAWAQVQTREWVL